MSEPQHHEHHPHAYERLAKVEAWIGWVALGVGLVLGAITAIGLLTATGHVTW